MTSISHEAARAIAHRFINGHFNNAGPHPIVSIPADPERDDDLRLLAYIDQCEAYISQLRSMVDLFHNKKIART